MAKEKAAGHAHASQTHQTLTPEDLSPSQRLLSPSSLPAPPAFPPSLPPALDLRFLSPQECDVTPDSENLTLSSSGAIGQSSCTGTPLSSTISSPEGTRGRRVQWLVLPLSPALSGPNMSSGTDLGAAS